MKIILASASEARKRLLEQLGIKFEVHLSDIVEKESENAEKTVLNLSRQKALNVLKKFDKNICVIACDTIVLQDDVILGKALDDKMAFDMLKNAKNKIQKVYTGMTVMINKNNECFEENILNVTKVYMRDFDDNEIKSYIKTKEAINKAGACVIDGIGTVFIGKIDGDYNSVMGLPLNDLYKILKKYRVWDLNCL